MRPTGKADGREPRAGAIRALLLSVLLAVGCAGYKEQAHATSAIWSVRVTTTAGDVADCRLIRHVDSRDSALGCGLTVQPTPEECLRYQVKRAGGDTLLMRGPAGEAYDCSGGTAGVAATPATAPTAAPAAASAAPAPPPAATATAPPVAPARVPETPTPPPAAQAPAPVAPTAAPAPPARRIRITSDRGEARGCVYLGDVASPAACAGENGEASGPCVEEALNAGGNLIVRDGAVAQIFACKGKS